MAEPFLGELRLMSFNFAPKGWAQANGQLLPINQNQPLFSLFGTMYGGDGRVNFALPDLRGRVPIHMGAGHIQGEKAGEEFHTLSQAEMPAHNHIIQASSQAGNQAAPSILAESENTYRTADELTTIHPSTIAFTGGSQPHENRSPFTVLVWCVALQGIFPSRT
ncbi:MAG: phage tail protein [Solirubrobacterales bacterium]